MLLFAMSNKSKSGLRRDFYVYYGSLLRIVAKYYLNQPMPWWSASTMCNTKYFYYETFQTFSEREFNSFEFKCLQDTLKEIKDKLDGNSIK